MIKQKYKPKQVLLFYRKNPIGKLANVQSEDYFPTTSVKDRSGVNNLHCRQNFSIKFEPQIIDNSESLTAYYHEEILS